MKRRNFLLKASGTASLLYLDPARALAPCPPAIEGGAANAPCSIADAEADWVSRINGNGVVWYHDFRTDAEVDAFRWAGGVGNDPNDVANPNTVRRITSDGITGSCLEVFRPAGSSEGSVWWRPFSPLNTGSGKPVNDPGAGGTIPVEPWSATQGGGQISNWRKGHYGHSTYHASRPGLFDGEEYYFQCRVKMDPQRISSGNPNGGKLFYFTLARKSLTTQEINTESGQNVGGVNYFSMYRSGSPPLENDTPGNANQPGSDLGFCDWPGQVDACWSWSGGWDILLYRVRPGLSLASDTIVQVWAAHPGETSYTKIWDQDTVNLGFDFEQGHNALICTGYQNNQSLSTDVFHRYCQLILSKEFIPCPQV